MTSVYTYDINTYFPDGVNIIQLHLYLKKNIPKYISNYEVTNTVYIVTSSALTGGELTDLLNVITTYEYSTETFTELNQLIIEPSIIYAATNTTGYTRIATFRFPGSIYQTISKFLIKAYVDANRTYNIKLQNYDTGDTIYESANLSNISLETIEFTSGFTNIPDSEYDVNVLVKLNGGTASKKVYVEYVRLHLLS